VSTLFNIYCDESCHLENDHQRFMVLGGVWCPLEATRRISDRLIKLKEEHGFHRKFEVKWTKVSPERAGFYRAWIDYFFDEQDLHFRAVVAPKGTLDHTRFGQSHDAWYYKMYYTMLRAVLDAEGGHRIYIDIKDTLGAEKVLTLQKILCHSRPDADRPIIERVQQIHSHESVVLQLADLLIGAVSYQARGEVGSHAKLEIVQQLRARSPHDISTSTPRRETKFNLFYWQPDWGGAK